MIAFVKGFVRGIVSADDLGKSHVISQAPRCYDIETLAPMFEPVHHPQTQDDWLAQHVERGQTFTNWRQHYFTPVEQRSIAVLPIGSMDDGPDLTALLKYLRSFFAGVDLLLLPEAVVEQRGSNFVASWDERSVVVRSRLQSHRHTKHKYDDAHRQFRIGDFAPLAEYALKHARGKRIYCVIGVSMLDFHMDSTDEFCMGAATMGGQVSEREPSQIFQCIDVH
jgi:hypothetical protein